MTKLFQYLFFPIVVLITIAGSLFALNKMEYDYWIYIPGVVSIGFSILFYIAEKIIPYRKSWTGKGKDQPADIIRTFAILPLATKLAEFIIPILLYFPITWLAGKSDVSLLGEELPVFWSFIIVLIVCEFCYYWMHRLSHTSKTLWRFHAVHHGAERVYWANAGRFHLIDAFFGGFAYMLPVALLGPSESVIIMIITFSAVTGFLEHVNINFKAGWLNYIFNTAELHRWHHSEIEKESNHNFGKALSIWDVIFRTLLFPSNRRVGKAGIEGEKVPKDFIGQTKYPFLKSSNH